MPSCYYCEIHSMLHSSASPSCWHGGGKTQSINVYVAYVPPSESILVSTRWMVLHTVLFLPSEPRLLWQSLHICLYPSFTKQALALSMCLRAHVYLCVCVGFPQVCMCVCVHMCACICVCLHVRVCACVCHISACHCVRVCLCLRVQVCTVACPSPLPQAHTVDCCFFTFWDDRFFDLGPPESLEAPALPRRGSAGVLKPLASPFANPNATSRTSSPSPFIANGSTLANQRRFLGRCFSANGNVRPDSVPGANSCKMFRVQSAMHLCDYLTVALEGIPEDHHGRCALSGAILLARRRVADRTSSEMSTPDDRCVTHRLGVTMNSQVQHSQFAAFLVCSTFCFADIPLLDKH